MTGPRLRRERSYLYWRQTPSWCAECDARVPGRIVSEGPRVYLERSCPKHGHSRGLLAESLEFFQKRMLHPARRADAAARRPDPPDCPRDCSGPCSWHEGPVRRLLLPALPALLSTTPRKSGTRSEPRASARGGPCPRRRALKGAVRLRGVGPDFWEAVLRASGEPLVDVITGESAADEAFLSIGRRDPDDEALTRWLADLPHRPGIRRAWLEAADGLPLDVLGARVARAAHLGDDALAPDDDAPLCLSRARLPATGMELVLHAPMQAATLDLTRLLSCPIWAWTAEETIVPLCWSRIRTGKATDEHR